MKNLGKFAVGVGLSASASYVWTLIPGNETFALASSPWAFLEHYHVGLVSLIVAKKVKRAKKYAPYLNGFGAGVIVIEGASPQPFGVGKETWQVVGNFTLTSLLILAYLW